MLPLIAKLQEALEEINALKVAGKIGDQPLDGRCLAVAATNLETAMLWVANARQ